MKNKQSKFQKQTTVFTAIALATGLLLNPFSSLYGSNEQAQPIPSSDPLLANITPVQREALQKLRTTVLSGFHLDKRVNTESKELISVIAH